MGARIVSILARIAGCLAYGLMLAAMGCPAAAAPPCCVPPTPPPPPSFNCCQPPGHTVNIPGVNVFVAPSVVVNASASAQANANAFANGNTAILVGVGNGGGGFIGQGPQGALQNLNVEAGRRTAYEATRTRVTKVVIQAACIDDKAVPHPASQVSPDRDIEDRFDGELFRCIAGTHLQATIAEYLGRISFDHGHILDCQKNEALYHFPGGRVECRAQKPARDCNERSLLRRFGAGVKILTMITIEKYTEYREETAQGGGAMTLDGGVGGVMY